MFKNAILVTIIIGSLCATAHKVGFSISELFSTNSYYDVRAMYYPDGTIVTPDGNEWNIDPIIVLQGNYITTWTPVIVTFDDCNTKSIYDDKYVGMLIDYERMNNHD